MTKPDEYPLDVWNAAMDAAAGLRNAVLWQSNASNEVIAVCLASTRMDERKRAIEACEAQKRAFLSTEYAANQPIGSLLERFACDECIDAIRKGGA